MRYPYTLEPDGADYLVRFPGVPEALTGVSDPHAEKSEIADCLIAALAAYAAEGAPLPVPAHAAKATAAKASGVIDVPVLSQAKLALIRAMAEEEVGLRALARRLGNDPKQVARLVDFDHNSRIGDIERALAALGRQLELQSRAA